MLCLVGEVSCGELRQPDEATCLGAMAASVGLAMLASPGLAGGGLLVLSHHRECAA